MYLKKMLLHSISFIASKLMDWLWLILIATDFKQRSACVAIIIISDVVVSTIGKIKSE